MRTSGVVHCLVGLVVLVAAAAAQADVTGTVFRDGDFDGSRDAGETGFGGVTIIARAAGDGVIASTSSSGDGTYRLVTPSSADDLRIEFALPGWPLVETSNGPDSRGSVRFVTDAESGVDLGLADPAGYCRAAPDLCAAVSQDGVGAGGADAATLVRLSNDGRSVATAATAGDTGSVFGLAVAGDGSLFTAAYLRRSAPFGPAGSGGVYRVDPGGQVAPLVRLEDIGVAFAAGTDPHTPGSDVATWPLVGRSSLGGLLLERSDSRLLVVNLASRELVRIPTSGVITAATADRTPITSPCSSAGHGSDADWRPFAVAALEGVRYVGGVCDGASTGDPADVVAHVVRQKPDGAFEPVLAVSLADRGYGPWNDSLDAVPTARPQPLLAGLAFSGPDLVLGIRDRYGDQLGLGGDMPDGIRAGAASPTGLTLRACLTADGWSVMTGPTRPGSCVPSDAAFLPVGGAMGGVSSAGSEIAVSSDAPAVQWLDALSGDVRATRPLESSFGRVGGVGSLAADCGAAPVEIAGRTFSDLDADGVQDAGDYGIGGVSVHLRDENGNLATTTTDGEGVYRFRVAPNSSYGVFIERGEAALSRRTATRTDVIEDRVDSDGVATRSGWSADVVTAAAGLHQHHIDFGFLDSAEFDLSLTLEPVVSPVKPIEGGETIELRLGVVNEGLSTVSQAAVGLYLSAGSTFDLRSNPGWTLVAQNPTVSLPAPLAPGATAVFSVVVGARYGFAQSAIRVGAEINSADGTDADSLPDTDPTNDAAGEDDRTSIDVPVTNRYDLALTLDPLPGGLVTAPDAVAYAVRVTNQGTITVDNHELTVYLPSDVTAESADNPGWSRIGATLVTRVEGPLEPGGSVQRIVIVHLPSSQTLHGTLLAAEVSDDDGVDADSIPNIIASDDTVGGDGLTDGTLGDEDDRTSPASRPGRSRTRSSTIETPMGFWTVARPGSRVSSFACSTGSGASSRRGTPTPGDGTSSPTSRPVDSRSRLLRRRRTARRFRHTLSAVVTMLPGTG